MTGDYNFMASLTTQALTSDTGKFTFVHKQCRQLYTPRGSDTIT